MKSDNQKRWYAKNVKVRKNYMQAYHQRIRNAIFEILGKQCVNCGFDDIRALQIDHIEGGGHKEKSKITTHYFKFVLGEILKGSTKYQVLCANCNWIKRAENKEVRRII